LEKEIVRIQSREDETEYMYNVAQVLKKYEMNSTGDVEPMQVQGNLQALILIN
jgi:hypothetical protein